MKKSNPLFSIDFEFTVAMFVLPSDAFSEPNAVMTPKEIYALLDKKQYEEAIVQAQRLTQEQPKNLVAYLALGDALSHYPVGDGDIHAAFDAWMQAKSLEPINSTTGKFAKERLAWTLESSAVVKLLPSSKKTIKGLNKKYVPQLYTTREVKIPLRTDVMLGGMYFSNIPTGEFILEIKPVPNLPVLVQKYSLKPGQVRKIVVPLNAAGIQSSSGERTFLVERQGWASNDRAISKDVEQPVDENAFRTEQDLSEDVSSNTEMGNETQSKDVGKPDEVDTQSSKESLEEVEESEIQEVPQKTSKRKRKKAEKVKEPRKNSNDVPKTSYVVSDGQIKK